MRLTEQQQRELDDAVREWQGRLSPRRGYPAPRKRPTLGAKAGFQTAPPVVAGAPATSNSSLGAGVAGAGILPGAGLVFGVSAVVAASVASVLVSDRIQFPFLIEQLNLFSNLPILTNTVSRTRIKVAGDNSTAGGEGTTGVDVPLSFPVATGIQCHSTAPIVVRPNFRVNDIDRYIKVINFHNGPGSVTFSIQVSILPLLV